MVMTPVACCFLSKFHVFVSSKAHAFSLLFFVNEEKYPSLNREHFAFIAEAAEDVTKTIKTVDYGVLKKKKPREGLLKVSGMGTLSAARQASVLVDGVRAFNDVVTATRSREVAKIKEAIKCKRHLEG